MAVNTQVIPIPRVLTWHQYVCFILFSNEQPFYSPYLLPCLLIWLFLQGAYGENASLVYPQGYGYAAYPYSPATSPAPQVGGDGQLYGAQQYQYPSYFPLTTSSGPFASSVPASTQSKHSTNKPANNYASAGASKGGIPKVINGSAPVKPFNQRQSALNTSSNLYGNSAFASGYQDPRFSYDGYYTPVSWHDGYNFSEVQRSVSGSGVASSYSKANNVPASRNQNYRSNSRYTVWYVSEFWFFVLISWILFWLN